jgi:hypothetical protein
MISHDYMIASPYGLVVFTISHKKGILVVMPFVIMSSMTVEHFQWSKFNLKI